MYLGSFIQLLSIGRSCIKKNANYILSEKYDKITPEKNLALYDVLRKKYTDAEAIYSKRKNSPVQTIDDGRDVFASLDVQTQVMTLMKVLQTFGSLSGGIDLTDIKGAKNAAATKGFSSSISNWKKLYKSAYIVDRSASGLWEKRSENLLDLL